MKKKALLRPKTDPVALERLLNKVSHEMGLEQKANELALLRLWDRCVAERFRGSTKAVKVLKKSGQKRLLVQVAHAALASDLSFSLEACCQALNQYTAQTGIRLDKIELRVGPL